MTGLTIPRAGNVAGRAARAAPVADPIGGQLLDQLGSAFEAVSKDLLDRQMGRLQVDVTRDLNDLRLEVEQIGDPDAADRAWSAGLDRLRTGYEAPDAEGRPRVDPLNAERFGLAFDSLANRHAFGLGRRNVALRQAQREATWIDYSHEAARTVADTGPDAIPNLLEQGDAQIDALEAAGAIDAAEAAARKQGLRADLSGARARNLVTNDPAALLDLTAADLPGLSAAQLQGYQRQARAAVDRNAAAVQRDMEAAAKERDRSIDATMAEHRAIWEAGQTAAIPEGFYDDQAVQARPDYARTIAARTLYEEIPDLARMTPAELRDLRTAEANRPKAHAYQTERLAEIDRLLAAAETGYGTDPLATGMERGVIPQTDLPDYDPRNRTEFVQSLARLADQGEELVQAEYARTARVLTDEQADRWHAALEAADPTRRAEMARDVGIALGQFPPTAIAEMAGGDPVFAHVAGLLAENPAVMTLATRILRGQAEIAEKNVTMPQRAARLDAAHGTMSGIFFGLSNGAAAEAQVRAAADALYADKMKLEGPQDDIDTDVYLQALHEVMGGRGAVGSNDAMGGVQTVLGMPTVVPQGISQEDVAHVFEDRLGVRDISNPAGQGAILAPGQDPRAVARQQADALRAVPPGVDLGTYPVLDNDVLAAQLAAASLTGKAPFFRDRPLSHDVLAQSYIQAIGDDTYRIVFQSQSGERSLRDEDGNEYRFSLRRLIREVAP